MAEKAKITLYLSPICAKWADKNINSERSFYKKQLRKLIDLLVEEKPKSPKSETYTEEVKVDVLLPSKIMPDLQSGRWAEWWISPHNMKQLNKLIENFWKHELTYMVDIRKNDESTTDVDVMNDFFQLYDISSDELSDENAKKIIQRTRSDRMNFYSDIA